ncbi:MAG: lipopolysaccharide biosynthesis protein [Candidatus Hodarchaeota archaeon]
MSWRILAILNTENEFIDIAMSRKNSNSIDDYLLKSFNFVNRAIKKFRLLSPEALWVFVSQAGTAIAGLLGVKLLTHVLKPFEFGLLVLASTVITLIGTSFFGPFGQGLMRFWSISKERGSLDVFYAVSNRLAKYISMATFLVTFISIFILFMIKKYDWSILIALSLIIGIITGIFGLKISVFTAARQRRRTALLNISNTFLRPLIATFLVILIIAKANIALGGYLIAALFILFIAERLYLQSTSKAIPSTQGSSTYMSLFSGLSKEILSYSWPFLLWGIFGWIHMSCDRWGLQLFYGSDVVGAFAVVSYLANYPLSFGSSFLSTLFSPIAFQKAGDLTSTKSIISAYKILIAMTSIYILGASVLIALFAMLHRHLVLFISNINFLNFSYLLPGLTIAWAFFYFGQVLILFGLLANKPQAYIMPKVTTAIIACVGIFYLSSRIGPLGVVWGLIIANFLFALWCSLISFKCLRLARIGSITKLEQ